MRLNLARRARAQVPFLTVFGLVLVAVVSLAVGPGHWRRGTLIISAAMLLAALLRAVLPDAMAGLLAVRHRWIDTTCFLILGVVILVADIRLRH